MATLAPPAIEINDVVKDYRGLRPLRLGTLTVREGERVAISGIDATAAEVLVNLVNGAILPDQGSIRVFGADTAAIVDESAWLASLDRFGLVTPRAVLLDGATLLQNLALPLTLEIDAIGGAVEARVRDLAERVGIPKGQLNATTGDVPPDVRMRVHLARSIALRPQIVLLEHPTAGVPPELVGTFARDAARVLATESLTTLAVSNDDVFCDIVTQRTYRLHPATGRLSAAGRWRRWFGG
jgi:ABC-type transporter Mla maintaining outer membrane lipid asymmetry ATPase subunit MlaF